MIKSIRIKDFRGFTTFSFTLDDMNILVGANNAGKSTILEVFRAFWGAYRYASSRLPEIINIPEIGQKRGFIIPKSSLPINLENIRYNCQSTSAILTFIFENNNKLILVFTSQDYVYLYIDYNYENEYIGTWTTKIFKRIFNSDIALVPALGQLETEEEIHEIDYVQRWQNSHRAYRAFRNWWYYFNGNFDEFKKLVEETWPGMSVKPPEINLYENRITMFCVENGYDRELSWAGSGFQIWLQMLTHIMRGKEHDLIIVDEPEIYLHADLQRKLLRILRSINSRIILATHSIEIINDAEPEEVLIIDKSRKHATRLSYINDLQQATDILGSSHNIQLTKLARGRKILFVEGKDGKILEKLAIKAGFNNLVSNDNLTVLPLGGFTQWERAKDSEWTFKNVLDEKIDIIFLLDRDYRTKPIVDKILFELNNVAYYSHILAAKEIENYLLIPELVEYVMTWKATKIGLTLNAESGFAGIETFLYNVTESFKSSVSYQYIANILKDNEGSSKSIPTILKEANEWFDTCWIDLNKRLQLVPGKEVIGAISSACQKQWKFSISSSLLISNIRKKNIPLELTDFFKVLAKFIGISEDED